MRMNKNKLKLMCILLCTAIGGSICFSVCWKNSANVCGTRTITQKPIEYFGLVTFTCTTESSMNYSITSFASQGYTDYSFVTEKCEWSCIGTNKFGGKHPLYEEDDVTGSIATGNECQDPNS